MKNLFLVLVCVLGKSTTFFCQEKFITEDLIGYWEPDKSSTHLVIWMDINKNFQMVEFSTISCELLTLLSMKLINEELVVKTVFEEKNWKTESTFTFVDKNTLQCIVKGPINDTVIYTKIK
ncbi:hypothetical protein MCEGE10_02421 [Flavobacteriaceae bacterium]